MSTPIPSMVERVARAIVENPPEERQEATDDGWRIVRDYERTARAAIEAMRRPNRDVLTAFVDDAVSISDAGVRWEAAIDAALNEEG